MRIVTHPELPRGAGPQQARLGVLAFGDAWTSQTLATYQKLTGCLPEYAALYAVDEGTLIGQVLVLRFPYSYPSGIGWVSGISAVTTLPSRAREGVSRALLEEAHRREKEAGSRDVLLWTSQAWGAFRLYESLGYRTIYEPGWAVRTVHETPRLRREWRFRKCRKENLSQLERFHTRYSQGRLGFAPRPKANLRADHAVRELDLDELRILQHDGRTLGYAIVSKVPGGVTAGEIVVASAEAREPMLTAIEGLVSDGYVAIGMTPMRDLASELADRGYEIGEGFWRILMGNSLEHATNEEEAIAHFGTRDSRFACMTLDRF